MWWPITGKVRPDGTLIDPSSATALDTAPFTFKAVPADIEVLNRRASTTGDLDITALSFRAYCDVKDRYAITHCGSSFGEGFGPKVVAPAGADFAAGCEPFLRRPDVRIAIPGRRTTAFMLLGMLIGKDGLADQSRFVEMPFDQIIGAVSRGETQAGLVIHEGQLLFGQAGLGLVVDLGDWWHKQTGLPTPLGCNVLRRDLDARYGEGTIKRVSRLLHDSIEYALAHRQESLAYTMPFALANASKKGAAQSGTPTLERVDRYVAMYVNKRTVDMGDDGRAAVVQLLRAGNDAGLCSGPGVVDVV